MINGRFLRTVMVAFLLVGVVTPACKSKTKISSAYPAVLSVKIRPENPRATSDLTVLMEGVEGRDLTLRFCWKRNGREIMGETLSTLRHTNFSKHDTISVVVTPLQGEIMGESVESEPAVVMNSPPVITTAVLQPQPAYTTSQLETVVAASDGDNDYIVYSFLWINDDQEIATETSRSLSGANFDRGDRIQCKITPSDREQEGNPFITEPIVIVNSPPSISSQPPSGMVLEHSFTYKVLAHDPDEDGITFSLSPSSPQGMSIDSATGVIEWKIPKDLTGVCPIEVIVSDEFGGKCSQRFTLTLARHTT